MIDKGELIVVEPHYDDAVLTAGGLLRRVADKSDVGVTVVNVFSRSNYQVNDGEKNRDTSSERIAATTGVRLTEDLRALDELLGQRGYRYRLLGEDEALVRGFQLEPDEPMEFPRGGIEDFRDVEHEAYDHVKQTITELSGPDTHTIIPLAIKKHIDHVLVRNAVVEAFEQEELDGELYAGEDQPYAGLADSSAWAEARNYLSFYTTRTHDVVIDLEAKVDLAMSTYTSQVDDSYERGVRTRADEIDDGPAERYYRFL